jgi:hypothetical protein
MRSLFVALAALSLVLLAGVAPAGAASPDPANATVPGSNTTATPGQNQVSVQLSQVVDLESWSYQDGTFRLRIESDLYTNIAITDSGDLVRQLDAGGTGTYEVTQRRYDLEEGTQTIVFDVEEYQGAAAITIATPDGDPYLIQSGSTGGGVLAGPYPLGTLQIAVLSGAVSVALVIIYKVYRYSTGDELEPERVA